MNDFVLSLFGWKASLCSRVVVEDRSLLPTHPKTPKNSHMLLPFPGRQKHWEQTNSPSVVATQYLFKKVV